MSDHYVLPKMNIMSTMLQWKKRQQINQVGILKVILKIQKTKGRRNRNKNQRGEQKTNDDMVGLYPTNSVTT